MFFLYYMGIKGAGFKGRVNIRGRPKEQAKAEIMIMKHQESYEGRKRRRLLFTLLDIIMILSFILAIYFVYQSEFLKGIIFLIIAAIPLAYFIIRRILKNNKS